MEEVQRSPKIGNYQGAQRKWGNAHAKKNGAYPTTYSGWKKKFLKPWAIKGKIMGFRWSLLPKY